MDSKATEGRKVCRRGLSRIACYSQAHHAGVAMDCGLTLVVCSLGGRYCDMQGWGEGQTKFWRKTGTLEMAIRLREARQAWQVVPKNDGGVRGWKGQKRARVGE